MRINWLWGLPERADWAKRGTPEDNFGRRRVLRAIDRNTVAEVVRDETTGIARNIWRAIRRAARGHCDNTQVIAQMANQFTFLSWKQQVSHALCTEQLIYRILSAY